MDISIVIPTYNRREKLKRCLESLFKQEYPKDNFEIIVVDDGSYDGTKEMLRELSLRHSNLRYLFQLHKGPAAARNLGIKEARAEIVGFTDNDCIINNDWVKKMVELHRAEESITAIGGRTLVDTHNIKAVVSQFLSDGAIKTAINGKIETIFFPTCNVSLKKNRLNEIFNELFTLPAGEDLEFFWRIYKRGGRFIYREDIEIFHRCHDSLRSFLKQAYMYGRGNFLVQYLHNDHPLLKEIWIGNELSFIISTILNFIKIPRFSYLLGRRLIDSGGHFNFYEKFQIYSYFTLHKIMYLIGNIMEYLRLRSISKTIGLEYKHNIEKEFKKPEFIILDITHRCNLKCNICEIRKDKPIKEFTTDEVRDLIRQSISWGVKEFVLSGGEPFVREDIFEILDFVKENNYHIGVLTNGILLNKEFIEKLLPYLICNALSLCISLDALTPEIHDSIRGTRGCFDKTFNGLRLLSGFKVKYPNINFNVISIILNENLEELLNLAKFMQSLNVNSIQFQPLLVNNLIMRERSGNAKYWVPPERIPKLDEVIDSLIEFKKQNFYFVRNSENNLRLVKKYFRGTLTNREVRCLYGVKTMLIANNGDITTCFDCYGNTRNSSLKEVWFSERAAYARDRVKNCKHPCLLPCFVDV
ncbi:MAG: glycosyltransferase [Candidatus Omnitrophica bacterium]|nr:glycosyltransferase [Candidatus Omnitrophota bacterium]